MKTFEILDYGFESLPTENIDGKRYYITPTGEKIPISDIGHWTFE